MTLDEKLTKIPMGNFRCGALNTTVTVKFIRKSAVFLGRFIIWGKRIG